MSFNLKFKFVSIPIELLFLKGVKMQVKIILTNEPNIQNIDKIFYLKLLENILKIVK